MLGKNNWNVQDTTDHSWSDGQAPRPKEGNVISQAAKHSTAGS